MSIREVHAIFIRAVIGITLFFLLMSNAVTAIQIDSCREISAPGEYVLSNDIGNFAVSTCIAITSSDVVLDGDGHYIMGNSAVVGSIGVSVNNPAKSLTNVTVMNLNATNWGSGIRYNNAANGKIFNNIVRSSVYSGINVFYSNNNTLADNTAISNGREGLFIQYSNLTLIKNNIVYLNNGNGILLHDSNNNEIIGNNASNSLNYPEGYNSSGIRLERSDHNKITDNIGVSNTAPGISLDSSINNTLISNIVKYNDIRGLHLQYSTLTLIENNTVYLNNGIGIGLDDSDNNKIIGNNASNSLKIKDPYGGGDNASGIHLNGSNDNEITGNIAVSNTAYGISMEHSADNTLIGNNASSNLYAGIDLIYSNNIAIINNTARYNGGQGVHLKYSNLTLIENNKVFSNNGNGIQIEYGSYDKIHGNNASNSLISIDGYNSHGIRSGNSNNITITNNTGFSNKGAGISLRDSKDNLLGNNNLRYNDREGIVIENSDSTSIENNIVLFNNESGIMIRDSILNTIIGNNASYSLGIHEGYNSSGIKLEHSDFNIISNNTAISNTEAGIDLYFSNESAIFNNSLFYNKAGIGIGESKNNIVTSNIVNWNKVAGINVMLTSKDNMVIGNTVRNNSETGISLYYAGENNAIIGNEIYGNGYEGIWLKYSSYNRIFDNILSNNQQGIVLKDSSDHNNLENNTLYSNLEDGITIMNSSYSVIERNAVNNHKGFAGEPYGRPPSSGIVIYGSHNIIRKNDVSNNYLGISILNGGPAGDIISTDNTVEGNTVDNNSGVLLENGKPPSSGIVLASNNNYIKGNNGSHNYVGIVAVNSSNNIISENNLSSNNDFGILMINSSSSIIESNIVKDHRGNAGEPNGRPPSSGIMVLGSHNIIRKNDVSNNYLGISILNGGPTGDVFSINNTVDGNDVTNNTGIIGEEGIPPSSGILIASNDNYINNNNGSYNYIGIAVGNSSDNIISFNNLKSNNYLGIVMMNSSNSVIERNTVKDHRGITGEPNVRPPSSGIMVLGSHNIIRKNEASNNYLGITILNGGPTGDVFSINNTVDGNDVNNNTGIIGESGIPPSSGILIASDDNKIKNNNGSHNLIGILVVNSSDNIIDSNILSLNDNFGIDIEESSDNNFVYNNYFNNSINSKTAGSNSWNISKTPGTNIIGGNYLGGNFWAHPNGTGFSQTCLDVNNDGICDSQYGLDIGNIDQLPLSNPKTSISIYTDKTTYQTGNKMYVGLNLTNPGSARKVGINIWVDIPGGGKKTIISYPSINLPAELKYRKYPWMTITLQNMPAGNYAWHATLKNTTTGSLISESISPWTFTGAITEKQVEMGTEFEGFSDEIAFYEP